MALHVKFFSGINPGEIEADVEAFISSLKPDQLQEVLMTARQFLIVICVVYSD